MTQTLALFGATGQTGQRVAKLALAAGHTVKLLIRNPAKAVLPAFSAQVRPSVGDARNAEDVGRVLDGADAVICTLGMSDIAVPATDFSDSVRTIVDAMKARGMRRIVAVASLGVMDHPQGGLLHERDIPDWLVNVAAEHRRNLATLRQSGLEWTLLCPGMLAKDIPAGTPKLGLDTFPSGLDALGQYETGYDDLAATALKVLGDSTTVGHRLAVISTRP